jgi:hypothetical protein
MMCCGFFWRREEDPQVVTPVREYDRYLNPFVKILNYFEEHVRREYLYMSR